MIRTYSPNLYTLRNRQELYSKNPKTFRYEIETVSYMASKIWRKVPETIKISSSFETRISAAIDVYYCLVDINWLVMKSQYLVKKYL